MATSRRLAVLRCQLGAGGDAAQQHASRSLFRKPAAGNDTARMFEGKVVLVTGAGKGIGEAAALMFAEQGASLLLADLDADAVESVAAKARGLGVPAATLACDITAHDAPTRLVTAVQQQYGRLDVLVNNAGYTYDGVIHKTTDAQWQAMLAVHCTAPFRLVQAFEPLMRGAAKAEAAASPSGTASPRAIINISSTSGTHGNAGQANYSTAKAGVLGLTKAIAKEWGGFNIRCNAIAFGLIDTRLTRPKEGGEAISVSGQQVSLGIPDAEAFRSMAELTVPLRRIGSARDAAGAILFLASPWSEYITGQVLEVNGGAYM